MMSSSLLKMLTPALVLATATTDASGAQPQETPWVKANSIEFVATSPSGIFQTFGSGSSVFNDMRERLKDPKKRAELRVEQRASMVDQHYGVAEALQLDETTFEQLMDLLTDQQMAQLEEFHLRMGNPALNHGPDKELHARATRVSKDLDELRALLGQEKLEQYQALRVSLNNRRQVRALDDRLDTPHKLTGAQREQLVALFHDHLMQDIERRRGLMSRRSPPFGPPTRQMPSMEELQRSSQLMTIESNEEIWRDLPESNRQLRQRAAAFLTDAQLAGLERMHEEHAAQMQQRIEQMRLQAGLSPTIPDQAPTVEAPVGKFVGEVKLSMKFTVNRGESKTFSEVVSSGKTVGFEIGEGLLVEATTTVFENDMYDLRIKYYETGTTGKREIGNMGQGGSILRTPSGDLSGHLGGGGGTVITGNKAYAIQVSSVVEAT